MKRTYWVLLALLLPLVYLGAQTVSTEYSSSPGTRVDRARGQFGNELKILSADVLNSISARGHDGTSYSTADVVVMEFTADGNFSTTSHPTKIIFKTTPANSVTAATVGTFSSDGGFFPYSRTEAQLKASTPTAVGGMWYDSTNDQFVKSTGTTTSFDYAAAQSTTTLAPIGW